MATRNGTDERDRSRTRLLLTGMSAVGKSTLVSALQSEADGIEAVDIGEPPYSATLPFDGGHDWCWVDAEVAELLAAPGERPLVVAGTAPNMGTYLPWFDAVVLLTATVEETVARLAARTTNAFGRTPAERDKVLRDKRDVEPLLRRIATHELATDAPVEQTLAAIRRIIDDTRSAPADP